MKTAVYDQIQRGNRAIKAGNVPELVLTFAELSRLAYEETRHGVEFDDSLEDEPEE